MPEAAKEPAEEPEKDWAEVVDRLVRDDPLDAKLAHLELSRLITGYLGQLRAFDFREEWEDLIHEVLLALVQAVRNERIRERSAVAGYVWTITRNKFFNRLKIHLGRREDETIPWEQVEGFLEAHQIDTASHADMIVGVRHALERLPERRRRGVYAVIALGLTYEQAARETGIPLGTLKRDVRKALAELRKIFSQGPE